MAAIVYQRKNHFVNEFAWPAASRPIDFDVQSHQGYSLCGWNKAGLNYVIISELSEAEMERFEGSAPRADRLARRAGGGGAPLWNKRVPYLLLTYMPTRVQTGERVV